MNYDSIFHTSRSPKSRPPTKTNLPYREGTSIVASFPNKKNMVWTTILIRASPEFISHVEASGPFLSHIGKINSV